MGYALETRSLDFLVVVSCAVAMFLSLLVGRDAILDSYGAMLDGIKEAIQHPFSN